MKTRLAFPLSVLLHAVILIGLSVVSFGRINPPPPPAGMELEIIDVEHAMPLPDPAIAKDASAAPTEAQSEAVAPPVPVPADPMPAPQPAPQPAPPVAPAPRAVTPPAPAPVKQLAPGPVAVPQNPVPPAPRPAPGPVVARPEPVAVTKPSTAPVASAAAVSSLTPAPQRPRIDAGALSRMLAAKAAAGAQTRLNSGAIGSAIGRAAPRGASGLTARQRMNLEEMIRSQITPCWNPPAADEAFGHVTVLMHIRLDRSGAVVGTPEVSALKGANAANAAYARSLAGSVRRAVSRCSPLRLPPELFDAWSDVELNFDPKDVT